MSSSSETSELSDDETTVAPQSQRFSTTENRCFKTPTFIVDDEALYCVDCSREFYGDCPNHGPLTSVEDNPQGNNNGGAKETAPAQISIKGDGVWARDVISARVRFGPLVGKRVPLDKASSQYSWLVRKFGEDDHCVDASYTRDSNWMRYVNCALQFNQRNMEAIQYRGNIYFVTTRRVEPKEELLVWSGPKPQFSQGGEVGSQVIVENKSNSDFTEDKTLHQKSEKCSCHVPWECSKCVEEVLDVDLLKALLRSQKVDERFVCAECEEIFPRLKNMAEHIKVGCEAWKSCSVSASPNSDIRDPSENSDYAGKNPLSSSNGNEKKITSAIPASVRTHTAKQPYMCPVCDKTFTWKYNMSRHLRTHLEVKPCPICGESFDVLSFSDHLRLHGENPFTCSYCDEAFPNESHLLKHLPTHTEEKHYACRYCSEKFSHSSMLSRHLQTRKEEKSYTCTQCNKKLRYAQNSRSNVLS